MNRSHVDTEAFQLGNRRGSRFLTLRGRINRGHVGAEAFRLGTRRGARLLALRGRTNRGHVGAEAFRLGNGRRSRLLTLRLRLRLLKRGKVQTVYQFDDCRCRQRQAMGDLDDGLLVRCWRLISFFEMEPERSKCKSHGTTIKYRADKLVCVGLTDRWVVLNAKFWLLLFCHG